MKSFTWYQECKVINNVRRVRTSSNSQRWADRIDEFSATQHNNTTNIYKQTAHFTEYKFKRRSERKLEAMEANLGCLCSCYGPEPTKQRVSSRYIHYVHWSRSIKSTQRLTVQNRRGEERQPKYLNCGASIAMARPTLFTRDTNSTIDSKKQT